MLNITTNTYCILYNQRNSRLYSPPPILGSPLINHCQSSIVFIMQEIFSMQTNEPEMGDDHVLRICLSV